jgi:stearoyl-CoA desaturase (delta-9 desaturase)
VPEERIEKALATMQLQRANEQVSLLPNADEMMQTIQDEYDLLMQRMSEYYATKKRVMRIKKKTLKRSLEGLELAYKYKELKHAFAVQKEKWLQLQSLSLQMA